MVHKLYVNGAAHVHSPMQIYMHLVHEPFANSLVRKCVPALTGHWWVGRLKPTWQ